MKNPTTYYKQWDNLVLIKTSFTKEAIVFFDHFRVLLYNKE